MKKGIKVKLNDREITINRLPIGRYPELLTALKKLPKNIRDLQSSDQASILEVLPTLIGNSWDDFVDIIAIATELDREYINNELDLSEAVDIVLAIVEVNKYKEIFEKIKKATAQPDNQTT